jgi:poly(3-hydroxyalkanoate) depolymerase
MTTSNPYSGNSVGKNNDGPFEGCVMNTRMVRVGRQDIWVAVKAGPKDRPPLLLFNGVGANLELAEPFMRAMTNVEVVIFDIPGVGGSPLPSLPYRPSTIARWAAEIMKQLGYSKIDVAGVSWGGGIAQQFAHQYPAVCRKLILAATSTGAIMVPGRISVLWKMVGPRRYTEKGYMRKIAADIYGGAFRDDPDLINAHAQNMKGASDLGYLYQLLALAGWTSLPWLHTLNQPTLILMGNDDPIVPLINGQILTRLIRDARLQIVQDGHLFFVTKPQETALMVERFIAEQ